MIGHAVLQGRAQRGAQRPGVPATVRAGEPQARVRYLEPDRYRGRVTAGSTPVG